MYRVGNDLSVTIVCDHYMYVCDMQYVDYHVHVVHVYHTDLVIYHIQ